MANNSTLGQSIFLFIVYANRSGILFPFFQLRFIRRLNQAPKTSALIVLKSSVCVNSITIDPTIGLFVFYIVCQVVSNGEAIIGFYRSIIILIHYSSRIRITGFSMPLQISGIVIDCTSLSPPVLGPSILGRISYGNDALSLVV